MIETETKRWRPQKFGRRGYRHIHDPLIEPLWEGERLLAHVSGDHAELFDADGETITPSFLQIADELRDAVMADSVVVDGYLTIQATQPARALQVGAAPTSVAEMTGQMFLGGAGRRAAAPPPVPLSLEVPIAFVAVDLLWLDGQSLLDVPLLERKRQLDSVIEERELVRRGVYVRPPVDSWLVSWRSMGFRSLAYKSANSRYKPGMPTNDWSIAPIPTR